MLRAVGPAHLDWGMAIIGNILTTFKATLGVAQQPHAGPQRGDGVEKLGERGGRWGPWPGAVSVDFSKIVDASNGVVRFTPIGW